MIWFAIIVNALLIYKLIHDWYVKNRLLKTPSHKGSAIFDTVIYTASALFLTNWKWIEALGLVLLAWGYRGLFFDLIFNLMNHWKFDFCGDSSKIDETVDKLDGKDDNSCKLGIVLKIVLILIGISVIRWA